MKISVIIPIYNTSLYLPRCIESILQQTYQNIEIICVDDGSTDSSLQLCKQYADENEKITVYHQSNQGVAAARNFGLRYATGEYISFVDSDDWLEPGMYEKMLKSAEKYTSDVVVTNMFMVDEFGKKEARTNLDSVPEVFDNIKLIQYAFEREAHKSITAWVWNKLFRRDYILKRQILFDQELLIGEDVEFLVRLMMNEGVVSYCDEPLYNHYTRKNSLSKEFIPEKYDDRLEAYEKSIDILEKNGVESSIIIWLKNFYCFHAANYVEAAIKNNQVDLAREKKKAIKKYLVEYSEINRLKPERVKRMEKLLEY